ncbi:MAG: PASTA domain-containing protein [Trueperaceae bacterium]|nr:PASTA domain-containing protein [Trueperaceae bacterium]
MPLIDGKYEILKQQALSADQSLVQATDPDGRLVRIVWYDVGPRTEPAFERYRWALRQLGRRNDVLLRDVVARPGAHYTVWDDPGDAPAAPPDAAWRRRLEALDLDPDGSDLRRAGRRTVLAGLAWDGSALPAPRPHAPSDEAAPAPSGARSLPRLPAAPPWLRTWLVGLLASLTALALGIAAWERSDNDRMVVVPDVSGMQAQDAAERLVDLGLAVAPQASGEGGETGTAVSITPPPGTTLRPGRTVTLTHVLPGGDGLVRDVPDLRQRPLTGDVRTALADGPWRLGRVARVPADLPAGTVMAQRPDPGARAVAEGPIDLLVSDGPRRETTFLPDLRGLSLEDARALARLAGLPAERILVDRVTGLDVPPGQVSSMTPAPWTPVRATDVTLRMVVAGPSVEGPAPPDPSGPADAAAVPDLIGLTRAEAERAAADRGLSVRVEHAQHSALPEGVILQSPSPGSPAGDALTVTVNVRPVALRVPEPSVEIRSPHLRWVPYRFVIEPGIPARTAEVYAQPVGGDRRRIARQEAQGGDEIEGRWLTATPGPVTFELTLGGAPYAEQRVTRSEPAGAPDP